MQHPQYRLQVLATVLYFVHVVDKHNKDKTLGSKIFSPVKASEVHANWYSGKVGTLFLIAYLMNLER